MQHVNGRAQLRPQLPQRVGTTDHVELDLSLIYGTFERRLDPAQLAIDPDRRVIFVLWTGEHRNDLQRSVDVQRRHWGRYLRITYHGQLMRQELLVTRIIEQFPGQRR